MSDIVKTPETQTLPSRKEAVEIGLSLSLSELCDRFELLDRSSDQGALMISRAAMAFSLKKALENDHPFNNKFKAKDWESICKAHDAIINMKDEAVFGRVSYPFRNSFRRSVTKEMRKWFPQFMTPELRECAVKLHARGNSTVNAIKHILSPACKTPTVFFKMIDYPTMEEIITEWLTPRLAYLKVGSSSFPQKYMEVWQQERKAYLDEIKKMPLTETVEQVQALSGLYSRLDDAFNAAETDRGKAQLSASMVKVMSGLYTLTRDPSIKAIKGEPHDSTEAHSQVTTADETRREAQTEACRYDGQGDQTPH